MTGEERRAVQVLRAHGYEVADIQSLAKDQGDFAVRVPPRRLRPAPGVRFEAKTVELGGGCFTNVFTLRIRLDRASAAVASSASGFYLRDLLGTCGVSVAVSGSFSFISDDPSYQPAEPCLDFCCRDGEIVSLPTAPKPAFLVHRDRPVLRALPAEGRVRVGETTYTWRGSKAAPADAAQEPAALRVFNAANCRVEYEDHPRTGFVRFVDRRGNVTPADPGALDCTVVRLPGGGHVISAVRQGGGADLFAGSFVLRGHVSQGAVLREGAPVRVLGIGGLDASEISSGMSVGPSAADAAAGRVAAYDASLGLSPFRDVRYARTLVRIGGGEVWFRVFDGAPLTETFQGVTPAEAVRLCAADGMPPDETHHLDGGQSSKIGFLEKGEARVLGSMHYLEWPRDETADFRWRGLEGRRLKSAIVLRTATR
ncbi:hypothetical protein [Streptomyces sp. ODS28]|uniref:hypothetical protein n=1 Tax=Streptomyces sp. ODS28 TaxID=3136688 RepID=UPI0031F16645